MRGQVNKRPITSGLCQPGPLGRLVGEGGEEMLELNRIYNMIDELLAEEVFKV